MEEKKRINEEELNTISGGFVEEMMEIADAFRQHGFEDQAKRLEEAGSLLFYEELQSVLKELGFPYRIEIYPSNRKANFNSYNGVQLSHQEILANLNRFLDTK